MVCIRRISTGLKFSGRLRTNTRAQCDCGMDITVRQTGTALFLTLNRLEVGILHKFGAKSWTVEFLAA